MEHFPAHGARIGVFRESPGSDIIQSGMLKKLKTMKKKYFVLRSTSSSGPARLDYYDNKKKFESGHPPKRSIPLHLCFNINKKSDAKHKFAIALYTKDDCFSIVMEDEVMQERWLTSFLEYQNEYLLEGESPKPHYDFVWQGLVKPPQKVQHKCVGISGVYRLCLSEKSVFLVKINKDTPDYSFQFSTIRRCGHSDNYFFMEVGRGSSTGEGELWMQVDDSPTAESMHSSVMHYMTAARSRNSSSSENFRRRSNTSSSAASVAHHRNTIIGDEFSRHRTASESHHGSPRRNRITVTRPVSTVEYKSLSLSPEPQQPLSMGSPLLMEPLEDPRVRSDSVGSRGSRSSRASSHHADIETPIMTPESSSVISHRSMTPESTYPISEEDSQDYLSMTPGQRSGSPSPTRDRIERPGSSGSEYHDTKSQPDQTDGYMDMKPGSVSSSMGNDSGYMDMMMGSNKAPESPAAASGYMVMSPGVGPSRSTAPIPIHPPKESAGYMDMMASGLTSQTQTLPTVKESGSGEAYLPMTPTGQSPISSHGLKPAKVVSYLSDDSMSGEFPKRAYSVGSRPTTKPLRHHHIQDLQKKQVLDNSRSSSAPHLIVQKSRGAYLDKYPNPYDAYLGASPLSQSYKSDDSDSFMEMDFYRPRTASDSYGCRPRASSFGKQYTTQGHRPRSSSYGQASRGKLSKLDSMDSLRTESQELHTKPNSEESLGKFSSSSRNSSSDSLKKLPEDVSKVSNYLNTDYMDMGYEKRNTPSPNVHNIMTNSKSEKEAQGYVDMTLGSSAPKSSRGVSPSSSSHSLGSSPASCTGRSVDKSHHDRSQKSHDAVVVKASGHVVHKPGFSTSENHLKVANSHLLTIDKRSPSSSGRESEDESYVPFQPASAQSVMSKPYVTAHDIGAKGHIPKDAVQRPTLKIQHGYSRSLDSGITGKVVDPKSQHGATGKKKHEGRHEKHSGKHDRHEGKNKHRVDEHNNRHGSKHSPKQEYSRSKSKLESVKDESSSKLDVNASLQEKVVRGHSPTLERKLEIPDTDIFSNKIYQEDVKSPQVAKLSATKTPDTSSYMEYSPGFEMTKSTSFEFKKKPSEYMEIDIPAMAESSDYVEADFTGTPKSVISPIRTDTSDYVEADFTPTPKTPQTPKDKTFLTTSSDKQYSSSPKSVKTPKTPKTPKEKDPTVSDAFQYMDFDPADPQDIRQNESDSLKTPTRVQAFISNISEVKEKGLEKASKDTDCEKNKGDRLDKNDLSMKSDSKRKCDTAKGKENIEKKTNASSLEKSSKIESAKDVVKDVQVDKTVEDKCSGNAEGKGIEKVHCDSKTEENLLQTKDNNASNGDNKGEGHSGDLCKGQCKEGEGNCSVGASKKGDDKPNSTDDSHNIVIRGRKSLASFAEPVEDEGYVDILDFSNKSKSKDTCGRQHHRSGSSSSSNSEKHRLSIDEIPCPEKVASFFVEEPCPVPETPKSYISDDSISEIPTPEQQFSYIQDESDDSFSTSMTSLSSCEGKENVLRGSGKTPIRSRPSSGSQIPSAGQIHEGVMIRTRSASGQPMIQTGGFSRQTSVPAVPSFSPRTSQEIQTVGRGRKASGPATFASAGGNKQLNSSLNAGLKKAAESQGNGQEQLTKQNSLPSMAVPVTECMPRQTIPFPQEMQSSRHSFTNLSAEYEQMSFPAGNLSTGKPEKSSSHQQLADVPPAEEYKLNYAQLDLHGSSEGIDDKRVKSRHPSSLDDLSQPSPVYAEIDHEKTENMKNASNKDVKFTL